MCKIGQAKEKLGSKLRVWLHFNVMGAIDIGSMLEHFLRPKSVAHEDVQGWPAQGTSGIRISWDDQIAAAWTHACGKVGWNLAACAEE
jgi:hypothetical protein